MTFLPIVERELRVAARRRATYWIRTGFGVGAIAIGFFVWLDNRFAPPNVFGQSLFVALAVLSVFYCLTCGLRSTADCLSEEKREGTLGLLFLTDLRGHDVILGKLAATSFAGVCAILATFPIMAVPLMMGGVSAGDFWRVMLLLVNTTLLSLSVGIAVSAWSRQAYKAITATAALLFFITAGCPILAGLIYALVPTHRSAVGDSLLLPCPFYTLGQAWAFNAPRPYLRHFWWSSGVVHALTWLFLALACFLVPRSWQDRPTPARGERRREFWRKLAYGTLARRQAFRTRLLNRNPVAWLNARARLKPTLVWSAIGLVAGLWAVGYLMAGDEWFCEGVYLPMAILLNCLLKLWVALEAGRNLAEDRKSGALELVLSTTLSVREMLQGQWMALRAQFLGPVLTVIALQLIFLVASLQRESFYAQPLNPVLWVASILLLLADLAALAWVGLWGALTARKPSHIAGMTFVRILCAPWVLFIVICILTSNLIEETPNDPILTWKFYLGLWFGLSLLTDLGFGLGAALHLRRSFRALALQRYAPTTSALTRWFRRKPPVI